MSISSLLGLAERLFNGVDNTSSASQTPRQHHHHSHQQAVGNQQERDSGNGDRFTPSAATNGNNATDNVIALQFERLRFSTFNITATPDATPAATGGTPAATTQNTPAAATANAAASGNAATAVLPATATELSLRFTGVNETVQSSGPGGTGTGTNYADLRV